MIGASDLQDRLKKIAANYPDRVGAALYKRAQFVMTEAKRVTPVASDGGLLRSSGQVAHPERDGRKVRVTLSFGGGVANDYAIAVHEHLSEHSPASWKAAEATGHGIHWTTPGTGPKFLEGAIKNAHATLLVDLANDLKMTEEV